MGPRKMNLLKLPLFLFLLLSSVYACNPECTFSRCRNGVAFKPRLLRDQSSPYLLRAQEKRWLPFICRRHTTYPIRIHALKSMEAKVRPINQPNEKFKKISSFSPAGLSHSFSKDYFHFQKMRRGEWVIVRGGTAGNQEKYLDDLCVTIPIKGYRYMNRRGKPRGKWKTGNKEDCLSFETRTVKMLVELRWNSTDDLDLSVEEPGGEIAGRFKNKACGKLSGDVGSILGVCVNVPDKSESIRYFGCLPKGRFVIRVGHYRNCGRGAKYEVRVTRFGKVVYTEVGFSDANSRNLVEEIVMKL